MEKKFEFKNYQDQSIEYIPDWKISQMAEAMKQREHTQHGISTKETKSKSKYLPNEHA